MLSTLFAIFFSFSQSGSSLPFFECAKKSPQKSFDNIANLMIDLGLPFKISSNHIIRQGHCEEGKAVANMVRGVSEKGEVIL